MTHRQAQPAGSAATIPAINRLQHKTTCEFLRAPQDCCVHSLPPIQFVAGMPSTLWRSWVQGCQSSRGVEGS